MSGAPDPRLAEAALHALGIRCLVESRAGLAVVTPAPGERAFEQVDVRLAALAALRAQGFTHAAVELVTESVDESERVSAAPGI